MRIFTIILLIFVVGCSDNRIKEKDIYKTLCSKKFISNTFGVTIYHSNDWSPYEFLGQSIGLEYRGLRNFERRYDAEIIITFFDKGMNEKEFYDLFTNNNLKEEVVNSLGGTFETKTSDKGITLFGGKKWKTLEIVEKGTFGPEIFNSRETDYLWYSINEQIVVKVRVKGQEDINNLNEEVNCILSKLKFRVLTAHNKMFAQWWRDIKV